MAGVGARSREAAPVRIAGGWIHGYAGAARRRGLGGHPNLDRITVAHPRNPLLHAGAAMDLFADVGVADSIMCGAHVVLDAGGEEEREYLDAGGGLLEDLSIGRKATMAIHPPYRATKNFLKPNLLKMHFSNKFVTTQVIHTPTATVVCSASSQEKLLKPNMESTRDVSAAAKIEKLLGERLLVQGIPSVSIHLKREQKYHGKVRAVIDSVTEAGVKLL